MLNAAGPFQSHMLSLLKTPGCGLVQKKYFYRCDSSRLDPNIPGHATNSKQIHVHRRRCKWTQTCHTNTSNHAKVQKGVSDGRQRLPTISIKLTKTRRRLGTAPLSLQNSIKPWILDIQALQRKRPQRSKVLALYATQLQSYVKAVFPARMTVIALIFSAKLLLVENFSNSR